MAFLCLTCVNNDCHWSKTLFEMTDCMSYKEKNQMKEVKAFKTKDGEIFETEKEAKMHERECAFKEAHFNAPLQCRNGHPMTESVIMDWLIKNKEAVLTLYGCSDKPSMSGNLHEDINNYEGDIEDDRYSCLICKDSTCLMTGKNRIVDCNFFTSGKDS